MRQTIVFQAIDKGLPAGLDDVFVDSHCVPSRMPIGPTDEDPDFGVSAGFFGVENPNGKVRQQKFLHKRVGGFQGIS